LWNAWWFHHAIAVLHTNPFHTAFLFHPFGVNLISHDFPLWMNLVTFLAQEAGWTLIASSNLWFALSWFLAGFCTYGLTREVLGPDHAGSEMPALVAGVYAMTHSYALARAMQNWGQFNFWGIALFLWCLLRARRTQNRSAFLLAGITFAFTAACHYYFLIYAAILLAGVMVYDLSPYRIELSRRTRGRLSRISLLSIAALGGLLALYIILRPGEIRVGTILISMRGPQNALIVMWGALILWGATHFKIDYLRRETRSREKIFQYIVLVASAFVLLSPLFWETYKLIQEGGYPKQSILWKTHLPGANLFALFAPNPIHALWGEPVSQWFTSRGMNPQEQAASIGWVCLTVVVLARLWQSTLASRLWLGLAGMATLLAMGTHLHLAQYNTWLPLPFFFARLLPVLGNVRVPERWMAVGAVAWAVVLALALVQLSVKRGWNLWRLCLVVGALILIENWPGVPYKEPPVPQSVYAALRELPPGGVLALPFYAGDSSIGTGNAKPGIGVFPWDHLWAQVFHQKPIVGGYIGRVPRKIIEDYQQDPFMKRLIDLEELKLLEHEGEPAFGIYSAANFQFKYVLVFTPSMEESAWKYVQASLPLVPIDTTTPIHLYRLDI
jgi:hypothetical protein